MPRQKGVNPPFTVPGQTYEPLPPGTFAGQREAVMGAAFATVRQDPFRYEYPTGGGTQQFQGLPDLGRGGLPFKRRTSVKRMKQAMQGRGNTVIGMGDLWDDITHSLTQGATSAAGALLQSQSAAPISQAAQQQAVQSAGASAFAWAQTHWKKLAVGGAVALALVGGAFYYVGKTKKR